MIITIVSVTFLLGSTYIAADTNDNQILENENLAVKETI